MRWFTWKIACGLTRLIYRLRVAGQEHLPGSARALLVSNHFSLVDGLIVAAANPRFKTGPGFKMTEAELLEA